MYSLLKTRGRKRSDELAGTEAYFFTSPSGLSLLRAMKPIVQKYSAGRLLDAGAGRLAWRPLLEEYCSQYISVDVANSLKGRVDALTDIQCMGIADNSFDTVFCSQVLEHVPEPWRALDEFYRILKPNGVLILSVPHLSHMHNEPNDYYRYTKYGIKHLLERRGFEVVRQEPAGGLLSFLGFIPATIIASLLFGIPLLSGIALVICRVFSNITVFFDKRLEKGKIYALNNIAVAVKK